MLHIYGQKHWHDDVWIVGDDHDLLSLSESIANAVFRNRANLQQFAADGEGYAIKIMSLRGAPNGWEAARDLALPYTDDVASEKREHAKWPWELL